MHVDELFSGNAGLPAAWVSSDSCIRVTGYQTRSKLDSIAGVQVSGGDYFIVFYSGPLTYDFSDAAGAFHRVGGEVRVSLGSSEFGKTTDSNWILVARLDGASVASDPDRTIEGVVRFVFGVRFALNRVFTRAINLRARSSSSWTHSILNPALMGPDELRPQSIHALDNALEKLYACAPTSRDIYLRALRWLNDAYQDTDVWDSFLKVWIAIEMAFIQKAQAPTVLRDRIAEACGISGEEVTMYFSPKRLYGLRKEILHYGAIPRFHSGLPDVLGDLFRDLLCFELSGTVSTIALRSLQADKLTIESMIRSGDSGNLI